MTNKFFVFLGREAAPQPEQQYRPRPVGPGIPGLLTLDPHFSHPASRSSRSAVNVLWTSLWDLIMIAQIQSLIATATQRHMIGKHPNRLMSKTLSAPFPTPAMMGN